MGDDPQRAPRRRASLLPLLPLLLAGLAAATSPSATATASTPTPSVSVLPRDAQPGYTVRQFAPPPTPDHHDHEHDHGRAGSARGPRHGPHGLHHLGLGAVVTPSPLRPRRFRLLDTGFSSYFAVLDSGELMTTADLTPLLNRPVNLVVMEETANATATHTLHLYVMDKKQVPRFAQEVYEGGSVAENEPAGTPVRGTPALIASGEGAGGAPLQYSIVDGNVGDAFALEQVFVDENEHHGLLDGVVNGVVGAWRRASSRPVGVRLVTRRPLDREAMPAYTLTVQAQDGLGVSRARAQVRVAVEDVNDNRPVFVQDEYHFSVFADNATSPRGRFLTIGQVQAKDADGDHVAYALTQASGLIVVVPQTGELLLVADPPLDAEVEVFIEAHDVRHPDSLTALQPARVHIDFHSDRAVDLNSVDLPMPTSAAAGWPSGWPAGPHHVQPRHEPRPRHRITKRRTTRAVRPTKKMENSETDGETEGRAVFNLDRDSDREVFKIRDPNPWVTVDPDGAVRVKKKWDYEELAPEKIIDFWVIISNQGDLPEEPRPRPHGQHHNQHGQHGHHNQQGNVQRVAEREKNGECVLFLSVLFSSARPRPVLHPLPPRAANRESNRLSNLVPRDAGRPLAVGEREITAAIFTPTGRAAPPEPGLAWARPPT